MVLTLIEELEILQFRVFIYRWEVDLSILHLHLYIFQLFGIVRLASSLPINNTTFIVEL